MADRFDQNSASADATISERVGFGSNALVQGWQEMLGRLLKQLSPYLKRSRIITFAHLTDPEKQCFESIVSKVHLPSCACGVFISPSARNQMMYTNRGLEIPEEAQTAADDGVILFSNPDAGDTIINVLLAHPPYSAAVDVYHQGALLGGYVYTSIDDCLSSLDEVVQTYLGRCA